MCVLSGTGTAAVINLHSTGQDQDNVLITHVQGPMTASTDSDKGTNTVISNSTEKRVPLSAIDTTETSTTMSTVSVSNNQQQQQQPILMPNSNSGQPHYQTTNSRQNNKQRHVSESNDHEPAYTLGCGICHLPYNKSSMKFQVKFYNCI